MFPALWLSLTIYRRVASTKRRDRIVTTTLEICSKIGLFIAVHRQWLAGASCITGGSLATWAGAFRKTGKNIGVDPTEIGVQLSGLIDDAQILKVQCAGRHSSDL